MRQGESIIVNGGDPLMTRMNGFRRFSESADDAVGNAEGAVRVVDLGLRKRAVRAPLLLPRRTDTLSNMLLHLRL